MSVSTTHRRPRHDSSTSTCRASCAARFGPEPERAWPECRPRRSARARSSPRPARSGPEPRESTTAAVRVVPGFGMNTRRAGNGRYRPPSVRRPPRPAAGSPRTARRRPMVVLSMPGAPSLLAHHHPRPLTGRLCDRPCPAARGTVARDRPWPPGKSHAVRHEPDPQARTPQRRN